MTTSIAIIGLGIISTRKMKLMRLHKKFRPDYLWDPSSIACENSIKLDCKSKIMKSVNEAIEKTDFVYLVCAPTVREIYAIKTVDMGKALFLEKPFGINIQESRNFIKKLQNYDVPMAVNFTEAVGVPIADLLASKNSGEM